MCESFNAVKAHFAGKLYSWKVSWPIRVSAAILQVNNPESWRFDLFEKCGFDGLHPTTLRLLRAEAQSRSEQREARRSVIFQTHERFRRAEQKAIESRVRAGREDYKLREDVSDVLDPLESLPDHQENDNPLLVAWADDVMNQAVHSRTATPAPDVEGLVQRESPVTDDSPTMDGEIENDSEEVIEEFLLSRPSIFSRVTLGSRSGTQSTPGEARLTPRRSPTTVFAPLQCTWDWSEDREAYKRYAQGE